MAIRVCSWAIRSRPTRGVDKIVAIGSDTISAGGQIGDTIVGVGLHITVVDWLKARFLNPNGANIQAVINQALAVPCTMI